MNNLNEEVSQGNGGASLPSPQPDLETLRSLGRNKVLKSGPLFLSSKGIGWTSWKKRWFILTQTSLVFFRSDPNAVPQKVSEVNITLGGIDLNNTGSVVVKAEKKLLTVAFSDGRDGRAFTLKAETTEDLFEWKNALESALAQAPPVTAQNGVGNDQIDNIPSDQLKDREPIKSTVIGRPILLALEEVDGSPSFLEKALQFIEGHGVKVEGILRQAADVEQVECRVREYEQGKTEFSANEDAHVIGDCIKHVLRELPSPPVPASCCKALVEACRTERGGKVSAMRAAINDTFPEPNRRLLQRILLMMQAIASHKADNRMSSSAVAACMAPLLLRSLMAGECEIENDFDVGGDGSAQLLQAAAAANHAQAIVITLLEEYDSMFGEGSVTPDIYTDSEESGSESEETTDYDDDDDGHEDEDEDEDEEEEDDEDVDEYVESILGSDVEDDDDEFVSGSSSKTEESEDYNINVCKDHDHSSSVSKSSSVSEDHKVKQTLSSNSLEPSPGGLTSAAKTASAEGSNKPAEIPTVVLTDQSEEHSSSSPSTSSSMKKSSNIASGLEHDSQRRNLLGRAAGSKNLSESTDSRLEDEDEIGRLEDIKAELQNQIAKEVKVNAKLQSELEKRKKAVHKRRLALEHDVAILQEQLQKEKNSRATLEAGLKLPPVPLPNLPGVDEKTKAELEELALVEAELASLEQKVDDLRVWLNPESEQKSKNKPDAEVTATSQLERSRSKENENERKPETTLPNKPGKRSGKKSEGKNSTSALTKLTTRLNFLKERRTQIANELQNMDKSQELGPPVQNSEKGEGSDQQQSATSPGKGSEQHKSPGKGSEQHKSPGKGSEQHKYPNKGAEFHISLPTPGKGAELHISLPTPGKGPEFRISLPSPGFKSRRSEKAKGISDKGSGKEGRPLNNPDKLKKSDSHPSNNPDKLKKSDSHPPNRLDNKNQHPLERGKSEGSQHFKVDKGR